MTSFTYLNFDVQIERAGDAYLMHAESPAGETVRVAFIPPFSDLELENFMLRAGPARRGVRRIDTQEVEAAKQFGQRMFNALFSADVRSALQGSLDEARRAGEGSTRVGVRIRLRLAGAPELANIPWEYIYNPTLNRFLVLSVETPLVRYLELPERIRAVRISLPLRIMVIISSPLDYPGLAVEQEWSALQASVADLQQAGLVELELLDTPTLGALQRQLRRGDYHILHFIGHGAYDRGIQDGMLVLEDEQRRGRPVSGQDLGMLLHDHASLRLVILNACEGARTGTDDPFAGVAQSLVQQGIPAVIAMQFEITDAAAITFAHEFYRATADGYPVDASLAEARKVMFADSRGNGLEWGTPVLYMRSPDGQIFDVQRPTAGERKLPDSTPPVAVPPQPERPVTAPLAPAAEVVEGASADVPANPDAAVATTSREATPMSPMPPVAPPAQPTSDIDVGERHTESIARRGPEPQIVTNGSRKGVLLVVAAILVLLVAGGAVWLLFGGGLAVLSPEQRADQAKSHHAAGITAFNDGDMVKAINELSQAIELKPDYSEAYFYRADAYHNKGMEDEAIADYSKVIELAPDDAYAYYQRGIVYSSKSAFDNAVADFTKAIELLPTLSEAYFDRGRIYLDNGQYNEAQDDFSKVIDLSPNFDGGYHQLGVAYAHKADYETAIQNYDKAIEISPDDAEIYLHRGEAYDALGQRDAAIADYRAVLEKSADTDMQAQATQHLEALGEK
jgi:tetratricopeptide (TPR) repeat protein